MASGAVLEYRAIGSVLWYPSCSEGRRLFTSPSVPVALKVTLEVGEVIMSLQVVGYQVPAYKRK